MLILEISAKIKQNVAKKKTKTERRRRTKQLKATKYVVTQRGAHFFCFFDFCKTVDYIVLK